MKLNNVQLESSNLTVLYVLSTVYWQPVYEKLLFKSELNDPIKGSGYMNDCQHLMK